MASASAPICELALPTFWNTSNGSCPSAPPRVLTFPNAVPSGVSVR
jgi:hypothetical protein